MALGWILLTITALVVSSSPAPAPSRQDIINGNTAIPFSAPYMVSLQTFNITGDPTVSSGHGCGGAILSEKWVVSVAHCLYRDRGHTILGVVAGRHDLRKSDDEEHGQTRYAEEVILHERSLWPADLALIKLQEPLEFNEFVQPIALPPTQGYSYEGVGRAFGWGAMVVNLTNPLIYADELQTTTLPIQQYEVCEVIMNAIGFYAFDPVMMCVGELEGGDGLCYGDSGSPFVQWNDDAERLELIGVASWTASPVGCGLPNSPSVYTKIADFVDWIEAKMAN